MAQVALMRIRYDEQLPWSNYLAQHGTKPNGDWMDTEEVWAGSRLGLGLGGAKGNRH